MKTSRAFWAGVTGALMISVVTAIGRVLGLAFNIEMWLGSMITLEIDAATWLLGLLIHLVIGGLFGLGYGFLFERASHRAGWAIGLGFGAAHAVIAGLVLGFLPAIHPGMPELIAPPGVFALGLGWPGLVAFVVVHLGYGAIVGGMYAPVLHPIGRPVELGA